MPAIGRHKMKKLTKLNISILICNALDHFDTMLYVFLAPIFAKLFFYEQSYLQSLIQVYGLFAMSSIMRPLGAYLFTKLSFKQSPIRALKLSIYGISITTLIIGLLPTYDKIGETSAALLFIARCATAIFAAGEVAVSRTLFLEQQGNSYNSSSYYESSTMIGIIIASIVSAGILQHEYIWRVPFICSAMLGFFAYTLRSNGEISHFTVIHKSSLPIKKICKVFINRLMSNITYYVPFVLLYSLMPVLDSNASFVQMIRSNFFLLIIDLIAFLLTSKISPKLHPTKVIMLSYGALIFLPILFFWEINFITLFFIRLFIVICGVIGVTAQNIYFYQMFKKNKYILIGNTIACSDALLGKATPFICLWIFQQTNSMFVMGLYISACAFLCIYFNTLD